MIVATPPPAIHAPAKPCSNNSANPADAVGSVPSLYSPACRWRLDAKVLDDGNCDVRVSLLAMPARRRLYSFCSSSNTFLHWLSDGRTAVINDYDSADSVELLVMTLDGRTRRKPLNLADILGRNFQKRAGIDAKRFVYHFYPSFERETPDGIEVALREDDVDDKNGGPVVTRCFIYHFFKPDYRHYKMISRVGPVDMDHAPCKGFAADRK